MKPGPAVFLFHLRVGARLALRVLAPVLAATLFLFYVLRPEFTLELARVLFLEGSLIESGTMGMLILLGLARAVAPRIAAGQGGWGRSLPAAGPTLRRLSVLSMIIAEVPLLAVLGGLAAAVTRPDKVRLAICLGGLLVGAAAAGLAFAARPSSFLTKLLAAAACFVSFAGTAAGLGAAAALLALAEVSALVLRPSPRRSRLRRALPGTAIFQGLSLRAVRGRLLVAYIPSGLILAASRLFMANNELPPDKILSLCVFGTVASLALFIGFAADTLAARRPVWPWARSLPRAAGARVIDDAIFLGFFALPLIIFGVAIFGRPAREAALLAGPLAWLALRGSGAMRLAGDRPFGALGSIVVEGGLLSLVLALLPWTAGLLAAGSPAAFLAARSAERRLKPTRWAERHHSNAGDPLSWSAS